jgi:hypothetical protein
MVQLPTASEQGEKIVPPPAGPKSAAAQPPFSRGHHSDHLNPTDLLHAKLAKVALPDVTRKLTVLPNRLLKNPTLTLFPYHRCWRLVGPMPRPLNQRRLANLNPSK